MRIKTFFEFDIFKMSTLFRLLDIILGYLDINNGMNLPHIYKSNKSCNPELINYEILRNVFG